MSANLLESLSGLMTPDVVSKAASFLGESEPAVSKGMGAAFPVLLSALSNRSSDDNLMSSVFKLVSSPANDGSLLNNVSSLLSPNAASSPMGALGGQLISSLFGSNTGNLANALGGFAGVKSSAASSMLNVAAPLLIAMLGKAVRSGNLSLSSLISMFTGQKSAISAALPGPLSNLQSYFATPVRETREPAFTPPPPPEPKSSIMRWLLPLLIALGALWLLSRCMGKKEEPVVESVPPPAVVEPAPAPEPMPAVVAEVPPAANVFFDVDVAAVPVGTDGTLSDVISYLVANPSSTALVSGYHDPTGNKAANEELAKNRAIAVRDLLTAAGVAEGRIEMAKPVETTGSGSLEDARRVEVAVRP